MLIEIGAPAILPLAFARIKQDEKSQSVMLGVALQHPPVHILAEKQQELLIHGPRAHIARQIAIDYLQGTGFSSKAEIQIENTIPTHVGFGTDPILALSVAQALAWVNESGFEDTAVLAKQINLKAEDALAYWGYTKGGALLVETEAEGNEIPALVRRHELKHKDNQAWAFVFCFPRVPNNAPDTLERDRQKEVLKAISHVSETSDTLMTETLWSALEQDDMAAFGAALIALRKLNQEALEKVNALPEVSEYAERIYSIFREGGAVAWGQSLNGIGLFALVRGAAASQQIRTAILKDSGPLGGHFSATITDNEGARCTTKEEGIHDHAYGPIHTRDSFGNRQD
jgi:predicted sugar kinase